MQEFWKDFKGDDETFWEHEFGKHGTCISTLEPTCYADYQPTQEVGDYFTRAVDLFKALPSHEWLAAAGIVPSTSATYTLEAIQAALSAQHGKPVVVNCKNKELNELWYQYNIQGSLQDGKFTPADPVGSGSTCPKTGIKYLPKGNGSGGGGGGSSPAPTTMTTSTGSAPTSTTATAGPAPTGGAAPSGKGRIEVSSGGFLISSGTWYRQNGATPATFTATPGGDGATFTLSSSKGQCAIQEDSSLSCGSGVSEASAFGYSGGHLTFDGKDTFYADKTPEGNDQGVVYATQKAVSFQASWTAV